MEKSTFKNLKVKYDFIHFFRLEALFGSCFVFYITFFSLQSEALIFNKNITLFFAFSLLALFVMSFLFKGKETLKKLRKFSFALYFSGLVYAIYVAYSNQYSLFSYAVLMIVYLFYLITQYNLKAFLINHSFLIAIILISIFMLDFKTEVDIYLILFSLFLLSCFGGITTYSSKFRKEKIQKRERLLDHIFDNSQQGLILVDADKDTINEINYTALQIFNLKKADSVKGKKVESIKKWNRNIFTDITSRRYSTLQNEKGELLTIKRTDFNFEKNNRYLLEINLFIDEEHQDLTDELKKVKLISEENYENLFKNSASFICIINKEGIIIDVNKRITNRLEYRKSEIIGKHYAHFDADDFEAERKKHNQKAWKGIEQTFEKAVKSKNGEIIFIEVILKKGRYLGEEVLISNSRDISKRKALEKKVKERTRIYKNLIENSSIAIAFTDLKGNFIEFNHAFSEYLEYEKEELLKMKLDHVLIDYEWSGEMNDFDLLLSGKRKTIEAAHQFLSKSKKTKHALLKIMLQSSNQSESQMVLHQIVDITGIVVTKNKLKKSEESYRNLFNYSNELLYMIDRNNKVVDVNQTVIEKYGYSKEEIINKEYEIFAAPDLNDFEKVKQLSNKAWEGEEIKLLWWSITKSGKIFPKDIIARKGTYFGSEVMIVSGRDISTQMEYEKKLKESSKKYKDLIDSSSWGIVIFKGEKIVFANKKAAEILRYPHAELIGKERVDLIKKDADRNAYKERLKQLEEGKDLPLREYEIEGKDGEKTTIELNAKQIEYEEAKCVLVSFIDIKDRKEIEEAKRKVIKATSDNENLKLQLEQNRQIQVRLQNEQSYSQGVIESSLDMIFTANKRGQLTRLNSAAKNKLGIKDKDYLGKHFSKLFEQETSGKKITQELNRKRSFSGELTMIKKDGSVFTAFISCSYLFNVENHFLGIMGISRDITEIKKQESEIKAQASKLNTIIESSSHYFFTINKDYKFTSMNKRLKEDVKTNYGIDIKIHDSFFKLYKNAGIETKNDQLYFWNKHFTNCFNGYSVEFETENAGQKGESFFREIFLNPIYSETGEIEELSGIGHDTTDKRLYEKELKKSLKEKEVLLQEVHHRVKNNMQVISSILNLQSAYVNDKKLLDILNESQDRIRAMAAIHERLYRTKNFNDVKFSSYIKNLAENLVYSYEYGEASIELNCEVEEIFLTLDYSIPCGLIVNELISNALKYAFVGREKGKITIELRRKGKEITLNIEDDGVGFEKEIDIKKADSLGLQLVYTLTEQIEGTLEMKQEQGTKYNIKFSS